jgi:uncharacterized protein YeaO (DUF488 family)
MIKLKRAYEPADATDGFRVLVDRMWPRGISKAEMKFECWEKDLAPSTALRNWFGHDLERWTEFRERYLRELDDPQKQRLLEGLAAQARKGTVTLIYSARDTEHNQAVVLKQVLDRIIERGSQQSPGL